MLGPDLMLASTMPGGPERVLEALEGQGWYAEVKWDGVRAVIVQQDAQVRIYNRRKFDITARYPDLVTALAGQWQGAVDGEIVCMGGDGRPDFNLIQRRDSQSFPSRIARAAATYPARFMPFDVLADADGPCVDQPYEDRRWVLEEMFPAAPSSSTGLEDMWRFVQAHTLEGLVLKRAGSAYRPGRQRAWVKVKSTRRISAIVSGINAGQGQRGEIGSLAVALWNPATRTMVGIGSVGTGMSHADLAQLADLLEPGNPPVVVEVEYLGVGPTGQLRMPVYKGIRNDVHPAQATLETLRSQIAS